MEEYKKQLPLRQQTTKPMLKYSSATTGLPYYQITAPSNAYAIQNKPSLEVGRSKTEPSSRVYHGSYSCLANEGMLSSVFGSHYSVQSQPPVPQQSYAGYLYMSGPGAPNGVTPAQILAASIQTSTNVGSKNPYAQPISIQELAPSDVGYKPGAVPLGSTSGSSVSSNGSNRSGSNPSPSPNSLQTNSFMRPRSAVVKDSNNVSSKTSATGQAASTTKGPEKAETAAGSVGSTNASSMPRCNSQEFLKTQPAPRPPSAVRTNTHPCSGQVKSSKQTQDENDQSLVKTGVGSGAASVMKPGDKPATPPTPQIVLFKPPSGQMGTAGKHSPPVNHFTDRFIRSAAGRENGNHGSGRSEQNAENQLNARTMNNSASNGGQNGISSPQHGSLSAGTQELKVRNPNYTPSRPYSEVSNPGQTAREQSKVDDGDDSRVEVTSRKQDANGYRSKSADVTNKNGSHLVTTNKPPIPNRRQEAAQTKNGDLRRMPVTNTMTGTVFYRKASKAEVVIHEVKRRPLAQNSTSKLAKTDKQSWEDGSDKSSTDEGNGTEEDGANNERLPGDDDDDDDSGRYCYNDVDDEDDDEALDNLEDDLCGSDDGSDTYSISTGFSSRRSSASLRSAVRRLQNVSLQEGGHVRTLSGKLRPLSSVSRLSTGSDTELQPALMPSLFPEVPPTINFVLEGQKVETLPWEFRKLLKWRMSPITPNVVKNCIARSGFRATKKNHDWLGYWGKHMKAQGFKTIREYQKINHFPGSFQIGRKDRLWRNLSKMQVHFGKKEFGFFPQTFILPFDMKMLKRAWEDAGSKQKWIIKPPASARGIGIRVISKWNQIPKKRSVIVQRYLSRPYLINDSKFDLRIYVYVTSYDPLRIYVYDDGLVRFASCKYNNSMKNINNKFMHLTNYSINKKNADYEANMDENICQGHKWGLKALWGYMKKQGINTTSIWENIKDLVIKTIISSESCVNSMMKANVRRRYCCHELFGFDVMLDETLKPWIIEVNISPSLHSNSKLDVNIKGGMIRDLFNICGFILPDKNDMSPSGVVAPVDLNHYTPPNPLVIDKRLYPAQLSPDERAKHAYYCQRHLDQFTQQTILDILTPDDLRMLIETTDEDSRRGNFQRIFPSITTHRFLKYLEQPRYYLLLLDQWVQRYHRMEARGVALLESLCSKGLHLENPTADPRHQWVPPSSIMPRDCRTAASAPNAASGKAGALPTLKKRKPLGTDSGSSLGGSTPTSSRPPTAHSAGAMPSS